MSGRPAIRGHTSRRSPGYGPSLPDNVDALLLHYQTGADDAHAVLLAVDRRNRVSVIGAVEGQTVDLMPWTDNTIRVSSGEGDPPTCVGWTKATNSLSTRPCR